MKGLLTKKIGMTELFDDKGVFIPVTVLQAGPCTVIQVKTKEKDGYSAVQLGFGQKKTKNASKAELGHSKKAGIEFAPFRTREIRMEEDPQAKPGDILNADIFKIDEFVNITGVVKGKGFQGVMKRYHFKGGRASHGGGWHRKPGSIGCRELPGKIHKGKRMPGHMGNVVRTVQNLRVVKVVPEDSLLFVKGAVPGANGSILLVKDGIRKSQPPKPQNPPKPQKTQKTQKKKA